MVSSDVESTQNANLKAADDLLAALKAAAAAQAELDTATAAHDAATVTLKLSNSLTITVSRRLAELVALINLRNIDIRNSGLSSHATDNWPHNPAEVYATMCSIRSRSRAGCGGWMRPSPTSSPLPSGPKDAFVETGRHMDREPQGRHEEGLTMMRALTMRAFTTRNLTMRDPTMGGPTLHWTRPMHFRPTPPSSSSASSRPSCGRWC